MGRITRREADGVICVADHGKELKIYTPNGRFSEAAEKLATYEDMEENGQIQPEWEE